MKPLLYLLFFLMSFTLLNCSKSQKSEEQLLRIPYTSQIAGEERDFFLYLPKGYENEPEKNWPVMMFLHGNGERGNGKDELDYVLIHGPLYEAWIQKRDLPFIMIVPQLHMFGLDTVGIDYITNRDPSSIPKRLEKGVPERPDFFGTQGPMDGSVPVTPEFLTLPKGWDKVENDLVDMIDFVNGNYRTDTDRIYLTGLSYGGFGTWYLASKHPELFAAISPVVGWGHPDLMEPIAKADIPVWCFSGGRDFSVPTQYFYDGINKLEELGVSEVRFTIHEDMSHDVWKRVYAGDDIYNWLLSHKRK